MDAKRKHIDILLVIKVKWWICHVGYKLHIVAKAIYQNYRTPL